MSNSPVVFAIASLAILSAPVLARAEPGSATDTPDTMAASPDSSSAATSPASAGIDATNTNAVVLSASQVTPAQAWALDHGDNKLVTNGPVPDTPENRARYGQPISHAGKISAPVGN